MNLSVELPDDLEAILRDAIGGDLNAYAREALAVDLYRKRSITYLQLKRFLDVGGYEADTIIKAHGGVDNLTAEELESQIRTMDELRNK